jgi:hypothetical protein
MQTVAGQQVLQARLSLMLTCTKVSTAGDIAAGGPQVALLGHVAATASPCRPVLLKPCSATTLSVEHMSTTGS